MQNKYSDLYSLIENDSEAFEYYEALPEYVQSTISERADSINSFESLRHYAENITQGDR